MILEGGVVGAVTGKGVTTLAWQTGQKDCTLNQGIKHPGWTTNNKTTYAVLVWWWEGRSGKEQDLHLWPHGKRHLVPIPDLPLLPLLALTNSSAKLKVPSKQIVHIQSLSSSSCREDSGKTLKTVFKHSTDFNTKSLFFFINFNLFLTEWNIIWGAIVKGE